jgi:hypothetical protein
MDLVSEENELLELCGMQSASVYTDKQNVTFVSVLCAIQDIGAIGRTSGPPNGLDRSCEATIYPVLDKPPPPGLVTTEERYDHFLGLLHNLCR